VGDFVLLGLSPSAGTLTPDAQTLYAADSAAGHIVPVAVQGRQVARSADGRDNLVISVGQGPTTCLLSPGGDVLLVVDAASNDLAAIRVKTSSLMTLIPVGGRPRDLAVKAF
jgi:YVTN family beta-propeller protein